MENDYIYYYRVCYYLPISLYMTTGPVTSFYKRGDRHGSHVLRVSGGVGEYLCNA